MTTCTWPIDVTNCCSDAGLDPDSAEDAPKIESVLRQVTEMMSRWSGYTFGGCSTIRPLDPCGECRGGCCGSGDCIKLHDVSSVTEVRVHGEVVPESDWHYDPTHGTLCAHPGLTWPTRDPRYQSNGSLEVDVLTGSEPDEWALSVATELACELLLACSGKKCRLPRNATSVTSQGVSISLKPDEVLYAIPSVMAWVSSVNPRQATGRARIMSPETRGSSRTGSLPPWHRR